MLRGYYLCCQKQLAYEKILLSLAFWALSVNLFADTVVLANTTLENVTVVNFDGNNLKINNNGNLVTVSYFSVRQLTVGNTIVKLKRNTAISETDFSLMRDDMSEQAKNAEEEAQKSEEQAKKAEIEAQKAEVRAKKAASREHKIGNFKSTYTGIHQSFNTWVDKVTGREIHSTLNDHVSPIAGHLDIVPGIGFGNMAPGVTLQYGILDRLSAKCFAYLGEDDGYSYPEYKRYTYSYINTGLSCEYLFDGFPSLNGGMIFSAGPAIGYTNDDDRKNSPFYIALSVSLRWNISDYVSIHGNWIIDPKEDIWDPVSLSVGLGIRLF